MSPTLDTLGKRLRHAREKKGLRARELGRLAGLSESHPSLIESGEREHVAAETLARLAAVLDVTTDWLLRGDAPEEPDTVDDDTTPTLPATPGALTS